MYRNLEQCVRDLEKSGQLRRIDVEIDPKLEAAAVQRRALQRKAPALLFTRVKGTPFPMLANMYGTRERLRYIFRDTLRQVESLFQLASDPADAVRHLGRHWRLPLALRHCLPRMVRSGPALARTCRLDQLPALVSWPEDGGAFITLPQVYTEQPGNKGWFRSNLGMYRVQLNGGTYAPDEVGMHYQIHRGIGRHHAAALARGEKLRVNVFVGGPPAMTLAAVMPAPEGMPELAFAGLLAGFRIPMITGKGLPVSAEADFCLSGHIASYEKKEGPFGDHLGYYSLAHGFPVMKVERVTHRGGAIWPFTSVGRPPQEDSLFGELIHEMTGPLVERMFAGIHEVHAVDAAGVHPLLLAVGSERYVPFTAKEKRLPQELLTCGLSLLGHTQTSLAKYVILGAREDDRNLSAHDVPGFFRHILERTRFERDLHFITRVTMDTLDYSGSALNQGSKLLWAAAGEKARELAGEVPDGLPLASGFGRPRLLAPGILVIEGPRHRAGRDRQSPDLAELTTLLKDNPATDGIALIAVADDADFTAASWENFLWVTFTRSDPATDITGVDAAFRGKHWGCKAPMVIDARRKRHHAPPLEPDPGVERRIDQWAARGGPLHGIC